MKFALHTSILLLYCTIGNYSNYGITIINTDFSFQLSWLKEVAVEVEEVEEAVVEVELEQVEAWEEQEEQAE